MSLVDGRGSMEITNLDINRISQVMNKDFSDAECTDVIQCLDSCDINACPGSGKTTTMVAKLLILSEKLTGTMTGICALSHTNAAKNEIEKSFSPNSGALMRYPHFVGTIQVFTDLFLAIPAYIEEFGKRPLAIDDDLYENVAKSYYPRIQRQIILGLERHTRNKGLELFNKVSYGFENFGLVTIDSNKESDFYCQPITPTYQEVLRWKREITALGYLTYHDAFSYANRYLHKYPELATIISNRFSFIFIDEMQDTDLYQNTLIESLFRGQSIIQKFGDPNQAIYGQRSVGGDSVWKPEGNHSLRTSKRLSASISHLSQGICSQPTEINGNTQIPDLPHTILIFDKRRKEEVIPRFGQIINDLQLRDGPFKALGAVGRPNLNPDYLSITSYWPSFQKRLEQNLSENSFWGYIRQAQSTINLTHNYSSASQLFTRAYIELLRAQNIRADNGKPYNSSQFLKMIRASSFENYNLYKKYLLTNCESLVTFGDLEPELMIIQSRIVFSFLGLVPNAITERIIRSREDNFQPDQLQMADNPNLYLHLPSIPIEINTIHAAKGQTHQATLVLETFCYQPDLLAILPYLAGKKISKPGSRILFRFLPLTYVACTRPSHLLCLAIQNDHINTNQRDQCLEFGWQIDESLELG